MSQEDRVILDIGIDLEDFFIFKVPEIIDSIQGDEEAKWGLMNVHLMLEHLIFPLNFLLDAEEVPMITSEEKIPRYREFLLSEYGMMKNFKFPLLPKDDTVIQVSEKLSDAKENLKTTLARFLNKINAPDFTIHRHPIYGNLNKQEWLLFQYKHFSHHFLQFGLI